MKNQKVVSVVPWYNAAQFQKVYQYLYSDELVKKKWAFDTISVWDTRCHPSLPAAIESTYVLTSAVIQDILWSNGASVLHHTDLQAIYGSAVTRFVNLAVEVHQDPGNKRPLVDIAKGLGMPSSIVSVRNEWCHHARPSLSMLRSAAESALDFLRKTYWEKESKRVRNQIKEPMGDTDLKRLLQEYMVVQFKIMCHERGDSSCYEGEDMENLKAKLKTILIKLNCWIQRNKQYFVKILVSDGFFIPFEEDMKYILSKEVFQQFQSDCNAVDDDDDDDDDEDDKDSDSDRLNLPSSIPDLPLNHEKLWTPLISILNKYDAVPLLIESLLKTQGDKTDPGQKLILAWVLRILRIHSSSKCYERSSYLTKVFKTKAMVANWKSMFMSAVVNPCKYTPIIFPLIFCHLDLKKEVTVRILSLLAIYLGQTKRSFSLPKNYKVHTVSELRRYLEYQRIEKGKQSGRSTKSIWSECLDNQHKLWPIGCIINPIEDENEIQPIEEDLLENFLENKDFSERFLPSNKNDDDEHDEMEIYGPDDYIPSSQEIAEKMHSRRSLLYWK